MISSQLIASEVFPLFIVKALLYPGAIAKEIYYQKTIPSYKNVLKLYNFNIRAVSFASYLPCLELGSKPFYCI
ncbi:hypothetical protein E2542_SST00271 [Spatholobus suberectus]|nr:hypothetical protein E2542_SST00271 [Spatholobus suberectus]